MPLTLKIASAQGKNMDAGSVKCPFCGGEMQIQTITGDYTGKPGDPACIVLHDSTSGKSSDFLMRLCVQCMFIGLWYTPPPPQNVTLLEGQPMKQAEGGVQTNEPV